MLNTMTQTLTPELLATFPNCEIFAWGICDDFHGENRDRDGKGKLIWIATKGGTEDWAIYAKHIVQWVMLATALDAVLDDVKHHGDKAQTHERVKRLVPHSDGVYSQYRR